MQGVRDDDAPCNEAVAFCEEVGGEYARSPGGSTNAEYDASNESDAERCVSWPLFHMCLDPRIPNSTKNIPVYPKRKRLHNSQPRDGDDDRRMGHVRRLIAGRVAGPVPCDDGAGVGDECLKEEDEAAKAAGDQSHSGRRRDGFLCWRLAIRLARLGLLYWFRLRLKNTRPHCLFETRHQRQRQSCLVPSVGVCIDDAPERVDRVVDEFEDDGRQDPEDEVCPSDQISFFPPKW